MRRWTNVVDDGVPSNPTGACEIGGEMALTEGSWAESSVAVVGIACRFPGARDAGQFWQNLTQGVESITFFTDDELRATGLDEATISRPDYVKAKGVLPEWDEFDAQFFGVSPREAELLDPQHRVFLECAWHALEDAGHDPEREPGRVGVFGGAGTAYYLSRTYDNWRLQRDSGLVAIVTSGDKDYLTTRVSYELNLKGPSINVQSACSTSLVAIVLGTHNLLSYQCDVVLAGGVSILAPSGHERRGYLYQNGGILSPDGHCRAFDAQAKGTVFSSGVGVVVLKRLSDALAAGDHIYSIVRGAAINNDGAVKVGFSAPGMEGQMNVVADALAMADVHPRTLSFFETHGTGTRVGDPIEIAALSKAFAHFTPDRQYCAVGSVKTNIGHTDVAAGVAGFIKASLAIHHRHLPPSLHFERANPEINFPETPFFVNTTLRELGPEKEALRAGVSAFGVGGTNACVILEETTPMLAGAVSPHHHKLLVLSAKTENALKAIAQNLSTFVELNPNVDLDDLAFTLQVGRQILEWRRFVPFEGRESLLESLSAIEKSESLTVRCDDRRVPTVFLFPGQGNQFVDMGLVLYRKEQAFASHVDDCASRLQSHLGYDIRDVIFPTNGKARPDLPSIDDTSVAQPALFVIEYALARMLMAWGIEPAVMIGHSVGEYVAACLAGVFSLDEALMLVARRGQLVQSMPSGSMLAVLAPPDVVTRVLPATMEIAAYNSPGLTIVAGAASDAAAFDSVLRKQGIATRSVPTAHAFHSRSMEPMLEAFASCFSEVRLKPPTRRLVSTVTGTWMNAEEAIDCRYWVSHVRRPVRFTEAIATVLGHQKYAFVEVGPGRSLVSALLNSCHSGQQPAAVCALSGQGNVDAALECITALGRLWAAGSDIDWTAHHAPARRRRLSLPGYPFERRRFVVESTKHSTPSDDAGKMRARLEDWLYVPVWRRTPPVRLLCESPRPDGFWAVFVDDSGLGDSVITYLRTTGQRVVKVRRGDVFAEEGAEFVLDPTAVRDYELLVRRLRETGRTPTRILYLWTVTPLGRPSIEWNTALERQALSFFAPLYLVQALIAARSIDGLSLSFVVNGIFDVIGDVVSCPEKALVLGPTMVFPQEHPGVRCKAIDVIAPRDARDSEVLAEQICLETELHVDDHSIAYRGQHRWTRAFERTRLAPAADPYIRLRDGGVYLVTGGLGALGYAAARVIAESVRAKLVLLQRSPLPPRTEWQDLLARGGSADEMRLAIERAMNLESLGAEVLVLRADVSSASEVRAAVESASARFGKIEGVFHAAGIPGRGVIALKTSEVAAEVLGPKVSGTLVLKEALRDQAVEFFVLFSSLYGVLAEPGQVDYCAANAFLDAFAQHQNGTGSRTLSIGWGRWAEVGMAAREAMRVPVPMLGVRGGEERTLAIVQKERWLSDDHRICGVPTLVGTAFLEMACALAKPELGVKAIALKNVYFLAPLMSKSGEDPAITMELKDVGSARSFVFRSGPTSASSCQGVVDHVVGEIKVDDDSEPSRSDLVAIKSALTSVSIAGTSMNSSGSAQPSNWIEFGSRWRCLTEVCAREGEWLARLDLPREFCEEVERFSIHPALLDVATAFPLRFLSDDAFLPIGYKKLTIFSSLPASFYSLVRMRKNRLDPADEAITFDIRLATPEGIDLAVIEGYTLRRVTPSFLSQLTMQPAVNQQQHTDGGGLPDVSAGPVADLMGIRTDEGAETLRRIMASGQLTQIAVATRDITALIRESFEPQLPFGTGSGASGDSVANSHRRPQMETAYTEPANEIEKSVVGIWESILGIEGLGVDDNFMSLGGNSLLAVQAITRTGDSFQVDLAIEDFFKDPTVRGIAHIVLNKVSSLAAPDILEQMLAEIEDLP
jgi:acyl transferase domain-containing protein